MGVKVLGVGVGGGGSRGDGGGICKLPTHPAAHKTPYSASDLLYESCL